MRLTQKKIEEILVSILGEEGLPLIQELNGKENVSEFDLAKKIKSDIKVVRKMLYILYNHNLVGFNRKKDKQKGWYIYYWTLLPDSVRFSYFKMKRNVLERLEHRLEQEEKELFFSCPNSCVRLNFDQAMDFEFHCPECGELLGQDDSAEKVIGLKKRIGEIKEELEKLQEQRKERRRVVRERAKKVATKKKAAVKKKVVKKKTAAKKKPSAKTISVKKKAVKKTTSVKKKTTEKKGKTTARKKTVKKKI
ncbi:hypothetical protein COV20_04975 [Candidatus Woesearchaeota archaeon CG10_big_fil_rev_8_21_14_0_10_45_16]|nr:MAG: hypothetical protein COV20_04975 [Candidatus Woesearchaeota archaeon CG10_big_fil_rev_8_21_14_0_10_45_16]